MKGSLELTCLLSIIVLHSTILVDCQSQSPDALENYYKSLYDLYEAKKPQYDCSIKEKWKQSGDDENKIYGTKNSLEYLSGKIKMDEQKHPGLAKNSLTKLRKFLARVGYLKVPGTLMFLNKQTETLRLKCSGIKKAVWKTHGEKEMDEKFHEEGEQIKIQAPNAANYIHKYTCFSFGTCSHTFYVITRPLPELPESVELRNNDNMDKSPKKYWLNCNMPYCNIQNCHIGKTEQNANRRAYPPYTFTWNLESRLTTDKDKEVKLGKLATDIKNIINEPTVLQKLKDKKYNMDVIWENKIRKSREDDVNDEKSYKDAPKDVWTDAFGEKLFSKNSTNSTLKTLNSRIVIKDANPETHIGLYECIIEDANGVVSTPSDFPSASDWMDYHGRTNLYILSPMYLIFCFGVSAACVVLVAIIILICPKKMEHDDGTLYTKEELVAPEKQGMSGETTDDLSTAQLKDDGKSNKTSKSDTTSKQNEE